MKKIVSLILAMVLVLTLSACEIASNETTNIDDNSIENTPAVPVSNGEWDTMLLNCDNKYFVVERTVETYNSLSYEVGVVDKDNNWICEPSSSNSLAECITNETGKIAVTGQTTYVGSENFYYLGNGVVVASLGVEVRTENGERISVGRNYSVTNSGLYCYFYNIEKNKSFYHNANSISTVIDEYIIIKSNDWTRITDTGENEINFVAKRGPYSEGLFLGTPDTNWYDDEYGFYDINGNRIIDLSEYDLQNIENTKFENGFCNISFKNPAGNMYYAIIDSYGSFYKEPSKDISVFSETTSHNDSSKYNTTKNDVLTVATNATSVPYIYKEKGKIVGFEAEMIENIAAEIGLKIEYKDVEYDKIIDCVLDNNADIGLGLLSPYEYSGDNIYFSSPYISVISPIGEINAYRFVYAIAVGKNTNLIASINAAINKMNTNGKIDELKQKYNVDKELEEGIKRYLSYLEE